MTRQLYVYQSETVLRLSDAIATIAGSLTAGQALLYSAQWCAVANVRSNGTLVNSRNQTIALDRVFEARIFDEQLELRWLNDPSPAARHRCSVLSERELTLTDFRQTAKQPVRETFTRSYLIWGEALETPPADLSAGWSALATPRIGRLDVPVPNLPPRSMARLESIEYVAEVPHADGNMAIWDERLCKLKSS